MEDPSDSSSIGSCDLDIGVKSQSNLVIAGSSQNWPKSSLS